MLALMVQAQTNPYPILPIDTVLFANLSKISATPPNDSSDYVNPAFKNARYGDTVRFEGICLFDPRLYGLSVSRKSTFLQADSLARAWGGVEVMCEPSGSGRTLAQLLNDNKFYDVLKPGNKVLVTGVIRMFKGSAPATSKQGHIQINMIKADPNGDNEIKFSDLNPHVTKPLKLRIDSLMTGNASSGQVEHRPFAEKMEGTYVELSDVTVLTRTPSGANRWFWSVADANGNAIDVADYSAFFRNENGVGSLSDSLLPAGRFVAPVIGTRISYLRGVIIESYIGGLFRYTIAPLYPNDLGPVSYTPPTVISKSRFPTVASSTDSVGISFKIQQGSAKVSSVKLFHTVGYNSTLFDSIILTRNVFPNDTMMWYGYIPARPNNSIVKYYAKPIDINGFFTYSPDTFGSYSAYLVKNGGIKTIEDVQFSPYSNNATIWNGDSVSGVAIGGIVTSTNMIQGTTNIITLQNGNGLNSAIIINRNVGDVTSAWKVGDSVSITATRIVESFGMTCMNNVAGTKISSGNKLPNFFTLNIDSIAAITAAPALKPLLCPYEGMLARFDSVYVVSTNADGASNFGEFLINKDSTKTTGLRVDDISTTLPDLFNGNLVLKQKMNYVKGIFVYSFSNWKLEPRDSNDLDFSGAPDLIKPIITLTGANPDSLKKSNTYIEKGFTASDNKDGNITTKVVRTGFVDSSKVGTYILTYTVSDLAGNIGTATRSVIVYLPTGINQNELQFAITHLYPNPAGEQLHLSVSGFQTLPLKASIVDISGRELMSKTFYTKSVEHNFDLNGLQNGIYFCTLSSNNGSKTIKFVVSK